MMAASTASRELFTEGVRAVLQTWPVLQIAVDNGFGGVYGQQKADWMVDVVQQYFHDNGTTTFQKQDNFYCLFYLCFIRTYWKINYTLFNNQRKILFSQLLALKQKSFL
uniref:Pre-rRNA-processing protein TSR2 homolog n=1 Tax=Xiphophorus couchianus TaxID=32473 RepID=A0A3B5MLH3_9TELE